MRIGGGRGDSGRVEKDSGPSRGGRSHTVEGPETKEFQTPYGGLEYMAGAL
jgi:hypothetical protein